MEVNHAKEKKAIWLSRDGGCMACFGRDEENPFS